MAEQRKPWGWARPYTPAGRLPRGDRDPGFATKPQLAVELVEQARAAGIGFRAVVADCAYGDNDAFTSALGRAHVPFVLAVRPSRGTWAPIDADHTPVEAAGRLGLGRPRAARRLDRGHPTLPRRPHRGVVGRRRHPGRLGTLPAIPAGGGHHRPRSAAAAHDLVSGDQPAAPRSRRRREFAPTSLEDVVRCYGLRGWVEQGYKQVKNELGWAQFQVRSDRAIRRHWTLVCCVFSFCWQAARTPDAQPAAAPVPARGALGSPPSAVDARPSVANGAATGARLADPLARAAARLAGLVDRPAAPVAAGDA